MTVTLCRRMNTVVQLLFLLAPWLKDIAWHTIGECGHEQLQGWISNHLHIISRLISSWGMSDNDKRSKVEVLRPPIIGRFVLFSWAFVSFTKGDEVIIEAMIVTMIDRRVKNIATSKQIVQFWLYDYMIEIQKSNGKQ